MRKKKDTKTDNLFIDDPPTDVVHDIKITTTKSISNIIYNIYSLHYPLEPKELMDAITALTKAWDLYERVNIGDKKDVLVTWGDHFV
jgi:hypothetical protein